jgi:hypothetical protein
MINKFLSIITEREGKREREGLLNCCRWKSSGRCGPSSGGEVGGGGAWSRRQFPGTAVKAGRMARFSGCFNMEEERGDDVEAHTEDAEEGVPWRRTRRRSERWRICDGEMIGLEFRGSNTLKKKISSDRYDDIINARCYSGYARHYKFLKNRV